MGRTRGTARRRAVAAVLAAGIGVATAAVPAAAAPVADGAGVRATASTEQLCTERVPLVQGRIDRALARIAGDEDTPGSIAFLQERLARAEERGNAAVLGLMQIRLENRQQLQGLLEQRRDDLGAWVDTHCGDAE